MIPFHLRPATPADANFVHSAWLKGACEAALPDASKRVKEKCERLERFHHQAQLWLVPRLMGRCDCVIAYDPADPTVLAGFLAHTRVSTVPALLWAYVKRPLRREGLFKAMWLAANPTQSPALAAYTSDDLERFADRYGLRHDPALAFELVEGKW